MSDIYDGAWRLFDYDAATGRQVWVLHDAMTGQMTFRVDTPVDAIVEANAEAEKATHGARLPEINRVASVPLQLYHNSGLAEAEREGDEAFVKRWLNDADNRAFRTSRGSV